MAVISIIQSAIRFSTIFLFGATGETITQKSGHLNMGTPGIMCLGALGGCFGVSLSYSFVGANYLSVLFGIAFALIFGAVGGALFSFFAITLKCNQNVVGLALTMLGTGIFTFGFKNIDATGLPACAKYFRELFPIGTDPNWFCQLFLSYGLLVYLAIVIAIVASLVLNKTRVGLRLRTVGENPATADASGINVNGYRYIATIIGSAISALGGLFMIMDYCAGSVEYNVAEYGWLAVAIVIFSTWRPTVGIFGSFVFGLLYILPYKLGLSTADTNLIKLIPYVVTIIILIVTSLIKSRKAQAPSALGITYDREER